MSKAHIADRIARIIAAAALAVFIVFFFAENCSAADITTCSIENWKTNISVHNDNTCDFRESVVFKGVEGMDSETFTIERSLPDEYKGRIYDVGVKGYEFDFNPESNVISITIDDLGMNDSLAFDIAYSLTGIDYMGKQNDEYILYIVPGNRRHSIKNASIRIRYPENMKYENITYSAGDQTGLINSFGNWVKDSHNYIISYKGSKIAPDADLTVKATLPAGYWANAVSIGRTKTFSMIILLGGCLVFILLRLLLRKQQNVEVREEIHAPDKLSPAHVGYLIDDIVENHDIMSLLYYLAQKGYMKITEYQRRQFDFTYIEYPKSETKAARIMFDAVFDKSDKGSTVRLSDCGTRIYNAIPKMKAAVPKDIFGSNNFYSIGSKISVWTAQLVYAFAIAALPVLNFSFINLSGGKAAVSNAAAVAIAVVMSVSLEHLCQCYYNRKQRHSKDSGKQLIIAVCIYLVLSALYIYFFRFSYNGRIGDVQVATAEAVFLLIAPLARIGMKTRNKASAALAGHVMGLQMFMNNCTKDAVYEISKAEPAYYYEMMSYAYAMNISRKFAGVFEYVELDQPEWYQAYGLSPEDPFDIVVMNSMIANLPEQMNKEVFSRNVASRITR